MQRCPSVRFGAAESDVEAFAHGYVAPLLSNTDFQYALEVTRGASYEINNASVLDGGLAPYMRMQMHICQIPTLRICCIHGRLRQ
jgi:hypothetical protein